MLQVRDGQTIVIGGLLENNINRDFLRKVPWLADIPIFGFLFRHKEFGHEQREVLFFMTPEIVKDAEEPAEKTPMMQRWLKDESGKNILEVPAKGYDWGLHDFGRMGLPERSGAKSPSAARPATQTPDTSAPAAEPTTNFTPARPAGP